MTHPAILFLAVAVTLGAQPVTPVVATVPQIDHYNGTLVFKIEITNGARQLTYQWLKNNKPLVLMINERDVPQITDTLILDNTPENVGLFRCVVNNAAGSVSTEQFRLAATTSKTAALITVTRKLP